VRGLPLLTFLAVAALGPATAPAHPADPVPPAAAPEIAWRESEPVGAPWAGRLRRGVQLPAEGPDWFTWDPVRKDSPSRGWRRWGTDVLVRRVLRVVAEYRAANPGAPRVGIGDLSRRHGGDFGPRFGGLGHMTHQNGLDADLYYPRRDGLERRPFRPGQVDRSLAQDLVDRFAAAGAEVVYVGPSLGLRRRARVVVPLVHHDDHLHVRIRPPRR
jgi:murein endopeptidase